LTLQSSHSSVFIKSYLNYAATWFLEYIIIYPHLNIHNSSTRSHPSEEQNRTYNGASVNGPLYFRAMMSLPKDTPVSNRPTFCCLKNFKICLTIPPAKHGSACSSCVQAV
jgi:hypothetical protein